MPETLFVGRERETEIYEAFLTRDTPWLLIITGLGGIGKTTLLHRLAEYTVAERPSPAAGVVTLDFAHDELRSDPLHLLEVFLKETAPFCDLRQLDQELSCVQQENIKQLKQLAYERSQTGVSEADDPVLREIRRQLRALQTETLYSQLKTLTLQQLVMMLDTCEWFNEPEGMEVGQWVLNELVPSAHSRLKQQGKRCAVVIASRVQPKLDSVNGREQRRLALSMLGKAAVDRYLERKGMQDANLRQRVYEVTRGHALCVSIIGEFWENREEQTQPLTLGDLPELQVEEFSEIALMRFTNERVLRQLKSPFKELTRYGVLLRSFDLPLLRAVFPELLTESDALALFNQLVRYPYIESRGNYRYAFHELVRDALAEETRKEEPETLLAYHKRALDYLAERAPHSPDWYYHLLACDEQQGLAEWQQAIYEARRSGRREYVGTLLQAALDTALSLSPRASAEIAYEQGRFNFYGTRWEEAQRSYEQALASFEEIEDEPGQAKVLQARGDVQRTSGILDEALTSYQAAAALFQQTGNLLERARCFQAMGDVQRQRDDLDSALKSYSSSADLFRQAGEQTEEAKVLQAMGDVSRLRGDPQSALHNYEQALARYQNENERQKRAALLKVMGDTYRELQDTDVALEFYQQALALFGTMNEPVAEAGVRNILNEMQRPQSEQKSLATPLLPDQTTIAAGVSPASQPSSSSTTYPDLLIPYTPQQESIITPQLPLEKFPSPIYIPALQQKRSLVGAIILAVIALIIILGGVLGYVSIHNNQVAQNDVNATATVTKVHNNTTGTAQAQAQATAHAAATATALVTSHYPPFTTLAYNDALTSGSDAQWSSSSACKASTTGYQVSIAQAGNFEFCTQLNSNYDDFAFQVNMNIQSGDCGGMTFRGVDANNFYVLFVCADGTYDLGLFQKGSASWADKLMLRPFSPAIHKGSGQQNVIAIVVQGNTFNIHINGNSVDTFTDSGNTFSRGSIALVANDFTNPTSVVYTNAEVWTQ